MLWPPPRTESGEAVIAGERHGRDHVVRPGRLDDQRGGLRDHRVPQLGGRAEARGRRGAGAARRSRCRRSSAASARASAAGRSTGGSSAQSSITCSGQPSLGGRRLGDRQRRRQVVPAPDERDRDGDAPEVLDRPDAVVLHQVGDAAHQPRRSRALDVVGRERLPEVAHRGRAGAATSYAQRLHSRSCVSSSGCGHELVQRGSELRGRRERRQAERVDQHEPADPLRVRERATGGHGAADRVADDHRRRGAGAVDQLGQPGRDGIAAVGQVGHDHAVVAYQQRDHAQPVRGGGAGAVQQHHGRAVAALEQRGGAQPPLGDREAGQQGPAGVVDL